MREKYMQMVESKNKQIATLKGGLFENLELAKKIHGKDGRKVEVTDVDWKQLYSLLEGGGEYFVSRLRQNYPNLNDGDIRFCMLVKLGLSNQDLSNIYCININSIKRKLYSFKEKIGITDKNVSLRDFIQNF